MRQLHELPSLFQRGNRSPVSTALAFVIVCGYALQWMCSFWGPGQIEPWLGLSQAGLRGGCLWQLFTYSFLGELENPLVSLLILIGLMVIGRELENIVGPKQVLLLFLSATVLPGAAGALHSARLEMLGAWPAVFALSIACTESLSEYRLSLPYYLVGVRYRFLGAALMAMLFTSWLLNWFPFAHASPYANLCRRRYRLALCPFSWIWQATPWRGDVSELADEKKIPRAHASSAVHPRIC